MQKTDAELFAAVICRAIDYFHTSKSTQEEVGRAGSDWILKKREEDLADAITELKQALDA